MRLNYFLIAEAFLFGAFVNSWQEVRPARVLVILGCIVTLCFWFVMLRLNMVLVWLQQEHAKVRPAQPTAGGAAVTSPRELFGAGAPEGWKRLGNLRRDLFNLWFRCYWFLVGLVPGAVCWAWFHFAQLVFQGYAR